MYIFKDLNDFFQNIFDLPLVLYPFWYIFHFDFFGRNVIYFSRR